MKIKIAILLILTLLAITIAGCKSSSKTTIVFVTYTEETIEYVVGKKEIDRLQEPTVTKNGFEFGGWYFDSSYKEKFSFEELKEKLNGDTIKIYAKWERAMVKDGIVIHGIIDNKVVINPAFDWDDSLGDASFHVIIKDSDGNIVFEEDVTGNHYELDKNLEYDKHYLFKVSGNDNYVAGSVEFDTISGNSNVDLNKTMISVSDLYKSHMVIQRDKEIQISGKSYRNTLIVVDVNGSLHYATTNSEGYFKIILPSMSATKNAFNIEIRSLRNKKITIDDVLVGDVFFVSGQSNIQWCLKDSDYSDVDVQNAINCDVRYYSMDTNTSEAKLETIKNGKWFKINQTDTGYTYYSAIAFMVGAMLGKNLDTKRVPIGIVSASQGDTNIVNWMDNEYYDGEIATKNLHYNAMIYPLHDAKFSGVIWYQGCNNSSKGIEYKNLLLSLFANWRQLFNDEELKFYVVQLPVYDGDSGNNYDFSYVRESQLKACLEDSNAYLIATCDGGDPTYIHPREKRYICERLTKSILSTVYNENYLPQGPTYKSHIVEDNIVIIDVDNGDGLYSKGDIVGFMLAGTDGKYYDASATIKNGKIRVTSKDVNNPVYIKYGFSKSPFLNIYNKDGYLMSPFRTDNYNRNIDLLDYSENPSYKVHQTGSKMEYKIVTIDGETGTEITKMDDSRTFASLQLAKWGAIGYNETNMRISVIGTNSNAKVLFRIVEGTYEIWAYSFIDNFTGKKTFNFPTSELQCVYNQLDNVIDYQGVMNIEITIEASGEATITILEAKFVDE